MSKLLDKRFAILAAGRYRIYELWIHATQTFANKFDMIT